MSLTDLGVSEPLERRDLNIGQVCRLCRVPCEFGTRIATVSRTIPKTIVCATCLLAGVRIQTKAGERCISRIKVGDGSPYPVETSDGSQWKDDEVSPIAP